MIQRSLFLQTTKRSLPDTCCHDHHGPCPYVSCRHHLLVDDTNGRLSINSSICQSLPPDPDDWTESDVVDALASLPATCSIEVANDGAKTSDETARYLGVKRQQVDSVLNNAIDKLATASSQSEVGRMLLEMEEMR